MSGKTLFEAVEITFHFQFFDLSKVFMEGDKYLTFDRNSMMSYVDNTVHLTSAGVKLCDPVFEKLAEEIMSSF